ncbi:MAG: hypothetical protein KGM95_08950, partial [Betaproteobacteria bacterium]|nr:hypothetical protein [Betaproteobacteria bacterium]
FLCTGGSTATDGIEQLVAALTVDPAAVASWKVRLTALKMLLEASKAPSQKVEVPRPDEPKTS